MKEAETTAREFAAAFHKLSQDVEIYSVKFDSLSKQKNAWDEQVDKLKTSLSGLNDALAK